jgi:hypothetical protein
VRVAARYDIHGNIGALDAVLADLCRVRVDAVVVVGDVAGGPFPAETRRSAHRQSGQVLGDVVQARRAVEPMLMEPIGSTAEGCRSA